ncbi:2OG-Fe(II) oxygenase [Paracoccaceae bacterium]|nr:2OG-Fe(II) oxygenase [Paracoccaceae bacterium]
MMSRSQAELKDIAEQTAHKIEESVLSDNYTKDPFQHIIIDNLFPAELSDKLLKAFPSRDDPSWHKTNDIGVEVKARTNWCSEFDIPDQLVDAIRVFNSAQVLTAMSKVLQIPKLMPDPYYSGGGLNMSEKNGHLDVHVDGNYHDASGMNRRVNLLYYLNPGWNESWGGEFGIYDNDGEHLVKAVAPLENRCVIFDTHDKSYHGLPNPIDFPSDKPRRSIILYYYTVANRPESQVDVVEPHSALWRSKSYTDKKGNKTRDFR